MKTKHTPGPWRVNQFGKSLHIGGPSLGTANAIEVAVVTKFKDGRHEANASLIAAAPELLEALRKCVKHIELLKTEVVWSGLDDGRAAIAKAEGVSS